jgi:hypothetical protein
MIIKYNIKEVLPKIFSVVIENPYDRAMTFCRAQEYYESPNPDFRGKRFSIWDYMEWYSQEHGAFTYPKDWSGFNVPLNKLHKLYSQMDQDEVEMFYDNVMIDIMWEIYAMNGYSDKGYVIGSKDRLGSTFEHELCHGLFATNRAYKKKALELVGKIKKKHYTLMKRNLIRMGYTEKVIDDEIQAYIMFGRYSEGFSVGLLATDLEPYHLMFDKELNNKFLR